MAAVFQFKQIKAKAMNEEAMRKVLLDTVRETGDDILKDFHATTKTWKHKPKFEKLFQLSGDGVGVLVGTDDEIYGYVNDGTVRHWVEPKKAKALAFPSVYTAKTSPGVAASGSGGGSGPIWFSKGHYVSGIKARKFDEAISKLWDKAFKRRMENAMKDARRVSGWAI